MGGRNLLFKLRGVDICFSNGELLAQQFGHPFSLEAVHCRGIK